MLLLLRRTRSQQASTCQIKLETKLSPLEDFCFSPQLHCIASYQTQYY